MISYIKHLLVSVLVFICSSSLAQETYYFEQIKVVKGSSETRGFGGQFISFYKDICYESNNKGETVGHGMLELLKDSNTNVIKYTGNSYWGKATYKFNKELTRLNIILSDGTIYVYNKSTPPKDVTTSSLIKKKEGNSGSADLSTPIYNPPLQGDTPPMGSGNNNGQSDKKVRENIIRETCTRCGGSKRIVYNTYPPMFGANDYKVKCNECGEYHLRSTGHNHITCPDCKGRGYKERKTYTYE